MVLLVFSMGLLLLGIALIILMVYSYYSASKFDSNAQTDD